MVSNSARILIVDDEDTICDLLCDILGDQGYVCEAVGSGSQALARLKESTFDLALLDIKMPGMSGIELLSVMRESYPATMVVMSTAVNDVNTAVEAMKKGALDYILKPFTLEEVRERVGDALRDKRPREGLLAALQGGEDVARAKNDPPQSPMDAIAHGVEIQVERFDFHSKIVTEKTVEVARQLGLSEETIEEWAANRREVSMVREKQLGWAFQSKDRPAAQDVSGQGREAGSSGKPDLQD